MIWKQKVEWTNTKKKRSHESESCSARTVRVMRIILLTPRCTDDETGAGELR